MVASAAAAEPAAAHDAYPCDAEVSVEWSPDGAHPCELTSPLAHNNGIPVYRTPVANPQGSPPPEPAGWLNGTAGKHFRCHLRFSDAIYYHPNGWRNYFWAYTRSDDGVEGWVPEVFFRGGNDDEPDSGMRSCPRPSTNPGPGPTPPPPPSPTPDPPSAPPPPNPCDPEPLADGLKLQAAFAGKRKGRARVITAARYGRKLRVAGTLTRWDGTALSGVTVCIATRDAEARAGRRTAGSVATDAQGNFVHELEAGPSQRIWYVYREGGVAASASVVLRVPAPVSFRASRPRLRNGQLLSLRGRLRGEPVRAGVLLEVQSRRRDGWQAFGTTRTRSDGRFVFRYRFTRTQGVARFRLRALVPAQRGYPFARGTSRAVSVRVSG